MVRTRRMTVRFSGGSSTVSALRAVNDIATVTLDSDSDDQKDRATQLTQLIVDGTIAPPSDDEEDEAVEESDEKAVSDSKNGADEGDEDDDSDGDDRNDENDDKDSDEKDDKHEDDDGDDEDISNK